MQLLFRQRLFSWLDSYDIYDETGRTVYTVEGQLSLGHCLHILDSEGRHVATVQQKLFTFLPRFELFLGEQLLGCIQKEWSFLHPRFSLDFNGWSVSGNFTEWNYTISQRGRSVAVISKQLWHLTDTYHIDVADPRDALCALMVVLAIDAEKCSRN